MKLPFLRSARLALYAAAITAPAVLLAGTSPMYAPTATIGAITGTVLDPRGAVLPAASVMLKNDATGATLKLASDAQGHYSFSSLPAGRYTLEVDAPGFTALRRGLQVEGQQTA